MLKSFGLRSVVNARSWNLFAVCTGALGMSSMDVMGIRGRLELWESRALAGVAIRCLDSLARLPCRSGWVNIRRCLMRRGMSSIYGWNLLTSGAVLILGLHSRW